MAARNPRSDKSNSGTIQVAPNQMHRTDPAGDRKRDPAPEISRSAIRAGTLIEKRKLADFCEANGIFRLAKFGSALRDDFNADSDVDFLVEFEPGRTPGLIALAGIQIELSEMLGGHKVDLRTPHDLSCYFRDKVLDSAVVQYSKER